MSALTAIWSMLARRASLNRMLPSSNSCGLPVEISSTVENLPATPLDHYDGEQMSSGGNRMHAAKSLIEKNHDDFAFIAKRLSRSLRCSVHHRADPPPREERPRIKRVNDALFQFRQRPLGLSRMGDESFRARPAPTLLGQVLSPSYVKPCRVIENRGLSGLGETALELADRQSYRPFGNRPSRGCP
jgi:hypothetical protein